MQEILTERNNLFEPNDYIIFYVELSGKVQAEDLACAIETAYMANEATMSKIVLKQDGTAYYEKIPESGCKVEIIQGDWQEMVKRNEKVPFVLEEGELVRCFISVSGELPFFVVMAHHLAGDGKAIVYFIESIMSALAGKKPEYRPLTLLTKQNLPKTGRYPFIAKAYSVFCNRKWSKMGNPTFSWNDYYNLHKRYWETTSSSILYHHFSKEKTLYIKENAKRMGVSVNSYIITAFLQADRNNRLVGIPVSVREKENKSMTNLTSGVRIIHSYSDDYTFSENAGQIHKKVLKELKKRRFFVLRFLSDLSPTLIDGVLLHVHHGYESVLTGQLSKVMGYSGKEKKDLGITNMTVLDIPALYGDYKIEKIIFIPPNISYSRNVIGVSTFNGEMTLTYHGVWDKREAEKRFFEKGIANSFFAEKLDF